MSKSFPDKKIDVLDPNWASRAKGFQKLAEKILKPYYKDIEINDTKSKEICGCDFLDSEYGSLILELSKGWSGNCTPEQSCVKDCGCLVGYDEDSCDRRY